MTKTLLLIAESFPPVDNIAAQRFPPMLPVLEAHGWTVWVLTQNGSGTGRPPLPEARIIRIGRHHQADARVRAGSRFAARSPVHAGLHAGIQGLGIRLHAVNSTLLTWYRAVMRELPTWRRRLPDPPDVVLGTYGPPAALWLARRLGAVFEAPWIADFRDPGGIRTEGRPGWVMRLDRRLEAHLLRPAAALTTCGETWAAMLEEAYGRRVRVLYNGWTPEPPDAPPAAPADPLPTPYLYYAGRFYERQMAAVDRLLEAVRDGPFQVVIRSLGPPEREAEILARARAREVLDRVHLLPPVAHRQVLAEARQAAATLVLEEVDTRIAWTRGHLSGKFLQLVPLPPPVLYVGRADAEAGDILHRTGKGALCTTAADLRRALERVAAGADWPVDRAAIEAYAKPRQGERLLELVEAVRAARAGALTSG